MLIGEGAEAKIYGIKFMGMDAVSKDRIAKGYREKALDTSIRQQRTSNEARCIARGNSSGANTPFVFSVTRTKIIMKRIRGRTMNTLKPTHVILSSAGKQLALLHSGNVVHGDYTPANIIVDNVNKPWIIDFGLSEISNSVEGMALDVLLMKRSLEKNGFAAFVSSYSKSYKNAKVVLSRMAEIEERGRYRDRTLTSAEE